MGDALMLGDEYGKASAKFSVNLLVSSVPRPLSFFRDAFTVMVWHADLIRRCRLCLSLISPNSTIVISEACPELCNSF